MRSAVPMFRARPIAGALILALAAGGTVAAQPVSAAPRKPIGPVAGLTILADQITKASSYAVPSDWADLAGATSYDVKLVDVATLAVVDHATVNSSQWTGHTTLGAGKSVRVTVVPLAGTRRGKGKSVGAVLPDLTAPTGVYAVTWDNDTGEATITQQSLSDDTVAAGSIARSINWDSLTGSTFTAWTDPATHDYGVSAARYVPQVRLSDGKGNTVTLTLPAVVINDTESPTGSFSVTNPAPVWAKFSRVSLVQKDVDDNWTPDAKIKKLVAWGDGTTSTWAGDSVVTKHIYTAAGAFTPTVTLYDEAANPPTVVELPAVTVKADTLAPAVSLFVPTAPSRIRSWRTLRGKAVDSGVGVRNVVVRIVQKRGTVWYAYKPATKTWVKGGATKAAALKVAGKKTIQPTLTNAWSLNVAGLRRGTLVVQRWGIDKVANISKPANYRQVLKRW